MAFNEILIPQDSFTETNVTRKRSVVEIQIHLSKYKIYNLKIIYLFQEIIFSYHILYLKQCTHNLDLQFKL